MHGREQPASARALKALLANWDVHDFSPNGLQDELLQQELRRRKRLLPPVIIAWDGKRTAITLCFPVSSNATKAQFCLATSDGRTRVKEWLITLPPAGNVSPDQLGYADAKISIPAVPLGYYEMTVELGERVARTFLISAPVQSWQPEGQSRGWGAFLPMYALNSRSNWGAGNFTDWAQLGKWVADCGGTTLATLPLTAVFLDRNRCIESPYSPASRLFWNEFYIDIEQLPEFRRNKRAQKLANSSSALRERAAFKNASLIEYADQMVHRRRVLEVVSSEFFKANSARRSAFEKFVRSHPSSWDYARFRAAAEQRSDCWRHWEPRTRFGKLIPDDFSQAAANYHAYAQFAAHEQIENLGRTFSELGLHAYLDLPVGVHPDSFDVWKNQRLFLPGVSVGAPSDRFFTLGQNWGFPPLHPERVREDRYSYVIDYLRFQMRHAGMLRIDHVMGLHRLYWIPPGFPASEGAYLRFPAEEWHAIFNLESHLNQCRLVGENLGIVPPEVNDAMARHRLAEMFILQFEGGTDSKKAFRSPLKASVASINTHDTPTWAAHWNGKDIDDRIALGILDPRAAARERRSREKLKKAICEFLVRKGLLAADTTDSNTVLDACTRWLSESPAETVLINLEDLWGEELPQNVPGTSCERPNWRRKARLSLEEIFGSPELRSRLSQLVRARTQKRN
jgi:4-alpha-glucanotransferase